MCAVPIPYQATHEDHGTKLLVGLSRRYRRRHRLANGCMGFRVAEILEQLDLQAAIIVGDGVHNEYRLVGRFQPQWVLHLAGAL